MKGFPDSAEQFALDRKSAISVDSAKVFEAIRDNPTVKAVLAELRHTCYHGVVEFKDGREPITFGHLDRFDLVKGDGEILLVMNAAPFTGPRAVRILDAMGALVWSKERDA